MLIAGMIEEAKRRGLLRPAKPIEPWAPEPRCFLMCKPLWTRIDEAREDEDEKVRARWAELEAAISTFIVGGMVTEKLLKQLDPGKFEHWELLSRRPKPSLRVFGRFAMPDVFVGTHVCERKTLHEKWNFKWELEKLNIEDHWKTAGLPADEFFTDAPRFQYEAYITENAAKKVLVP